MPALRGDSRRPRTPATAWRLHRTDSNKTSPPPLPAASGPVTLRYLWTDEGWLYLAVIVDLYSRKGAGWAMHKRMKAPLVCDALTMALWRRRPPGGLIMHTGRGSQCCSKPYQRLLETHALRCSMSGKGNG